MYVFELQVSKENGRFDCTRILNLVLGVNNGKRGSPPIIPNYLVELISNLTQGLNNIPMNIV
jgi:hypothetical protein